MIRTAARRLIGGTVTVGLFACALACSVDKDVLYDRSYLCDPGQGRNSCGTDREGQDMVCYGGYQLGSANFCAQRCNASAFAADDRNICTSSGALLARCRPDDPVTSSCPIPDQSCLRTDALGNDGVCAVISTCSSDVDCPDGARASCLGTLLRTFYGEAPGLRQDHLSCLEIGCAAYASACPVGEVCLPKIIPPSSNPPDICVPKCDSQGNCPPNYFCYRKVSGPAAPNVCIPGILGFRCSNDLDCLTGKCVGQEGWSMCTVPCVTNADCLPFSHARGPFVCVDALGSGQRYCMNPVSFTGAPCSGNVDCAAEEVCTAFDPLPSAEPSPPSCHRACTSTADCPAVGGIAESCVNGSCHPGRFGVPCEGDAGCVSDLRCLDAGPNAMASLLSPTCGYTCATDADCTAAAHILIEADGRCEDGVCRRPRQAGAPCDTDAQCWSRSCAQTGRDVGPAGGVCQ